MKPVQWSAKISMTAILVAVFCGLLNAQNEIPPTDQLKAADCTPELFDRTEKDYRRSSFDSNATFRAEKLITKVLTVCPSASLDTNLQLELETLKEKRAAHFFLIARYYLDQFRENGRGLKAAQSRFLVILDKYPQYSRIEEVVFLLGETYEFESNYDEAEEVLRKLIKDSPAGIFRSNAEVELQKIQTERLLIKAAQGS